MLLNGKVKNMKAAAEKIFGYAGGNTYQALRDYVKSKDKTKSVEPKRKPSSNAPWTYEDEKAIVDNWNLMATKEGQVQLADMLGRDITAIYQRGYQVLRQPKISDLKKKLEKEGKDEIFTRPERKKERSKVRLGGKRSAAEYDEQIIKDNKIMNKFHAELEEDSLQFECDMCKTAKVERKGDLCKDCDSLFNNAKR